VQGWTVPSYEVTSSVVELDPEVLAAGTGPDVTDPLWTALPAGVPERVAALGRELAAGAATRVEAVERVERWLADNATYRLDSPVPGPGEDAVDRFLFVDRVGFCEQFAAAEVLLLRAAGIPARFVTGLGYGEDDGDRRTYRDRDLHAWVEVFHPGHGWVPSDPTPPSTRLASAPWRTRVAAELAGLLRRAEAVPGGRPALAVGVLALTALTGLALRRRRPARSTTCVAVPVAGRPALAAFLRFDARLGDDRRRPQETLTELSARLALPDDLAAALRAVEAECYAPDPPDAAPAAALLDAARPT
jgi:protein-glutamine gamma-glutamyltransferase